MKLAFRTWLEDTHKYAGEPNVMWHLKPDQSIGQVASRYMAKTGLDPAVLNIPYAPLNHKTGLKIADHYDRLQHSPDDPNVQQAYNALKRETLAQFRHILDAGFTVIPDNDPSVQGGGYEGAAEMRDDLINNKRLQVFTGGDMPADHPLAEPSPYTFGGHRFNYNELFRAVHDFFGHAHHGNHFGPRGEEHAYRLHSRMFSPLARSAMAAETRGQNSWVHFGPMKHIPLADRPYAQQKAATLPPDLLD